LVLIQSASICVHLRFQSSIENHPSTHLKSPVGTDRLRGQPVAGTDYLPRGLLQYNARFARAIAQDFLEFRRFFVRFRRSCLRAGNRGDFSEPDRLSAAISQDLCAACISQSPDSRAWREPRLGMKPAGDYSEQLLLPAADDDPTISISADASIYVELRNFEADLRQPPFSGFSRDGRQPIAHHDRPQDAPSQPACECPASFRIPSGGPCSQTEPAGHLCTTASSDRTPACPRWPAASARGLDRPLRSSGHSRA